MPKNNATNNQIKTLTKVLDAGYKTEKRYCSIHLDKILAIPNITIADINLINELQQAVNTNEVVKFLKDVTNVTDKYKLLLF